MHRRQAWLGLVFIAPWLIGVVALKLLPILASLGLSFVSFNPIHLDQTHFVGLDHYGQLVSDEEAQAALVNTLSLAVLTIPAQMGVALGLATLLNSKYLKGKGILRALFFMPSIVPGAAIFAIAFGFLEPANGWLTRLVLEPLGLPAPVGIFGQNLLILFLALWAIGPTMVIMLGAMQAVSPELYEAAQIDGAPSFERFLHITLPSISPAIFFGLIINLVMVFGGTPLLDQGLSFSDGLSAYDNYVIKVMFSYLDYGYAASLAWVFFILMLVGLSVLFYSARYWVYYADGEQ